MLARTNLRLDDNSPKYQFHSNSDSPMPFEHRDGHRWRQKYSIIELEPGRREQRHDNQWRGRKPGATAMLRFL